MSVVYMVATFFGIDIAKDSNGSLTIQIVTTLVLLWPNLAIGGKRCHDRNQSAWWLLLLFIPIIGVFWCLVNLGLIDGTRGSNRFGASPKDEGQLDDKRT